MRWDACTSWPRSPTRRARWSVPESRCGRSGARRARRASSGRTSAIAAALVTLAAGLGAIVFWHRLGSAGGGIQLFGDYDSADLGYYASEASEASHTVPPTAAYYSGHKLNAAYYPHLVLGMIHRFAGVPVLSMYYGLAWPTFGALIALTGYTLVRLPRVACGGGARGGVPARLQRLLVPRGLVPPACRGRLGLRLVADEFSVADHAGAAFCDLGAVAAGVLHRAVCDRSRAADRPLGLARARRAADRNPVRVQAVHLPRPDGRALGVGRVLWQGLDHSQALRRHGRCSPSCAPCLRSSAPPPSIPRTAAPAC